MNRVQLVQVIVIIIALVMGYQMVTTFTVFVVSATSYFTSSSRFNTELVLYYGVAALLYAIILFVIINNAAKITGWIIEKVQPDENIQLTFSDNSVLYAVLLFLSLGSLLKNIPDILFDLYKVFTDTNYRSRSASRLGGADLNFDWPKLIEAVIAFVLLVNIKAVVNYFQQKIDPHDPHYISDEAEPVAEDE